MQNKFYYDEKTKLNLKKNSSWCDENNDELALSKLEHPHVFVA